MAITVKCIQQLAGIINHGIRCRYSSPLSGSNHHLLLYHHHLLLSHPSITCSTVSNRFLSTGEQVPDPGSKFVKPVTGLKRFLGRKLVKFIEDYTNAFENKFPKAIKVYRVFSVGKKITD